MIYGWSYYKAEKRYKKTKEEFFLCFVSTIVGITIIYAVFHIFSRGGK